MRRVIEMIKPRIVFNGHTYSSGYKIHNFRFGTKYVYIDSSQQNRYYVILYTDSMRLEMGEIERL